MLPHLDAAYNLARWLMRDREAAEDVLQEAMVRALTYFAELQGGQSARLAAADRAQHRLRLAGSSTAACRPCRSATTSDAPATVELMAADDDPETALLRARECRQVRELIAALPVELRETLVLREFEELSYKEIAEVTRHPDRHGDVAAVAGAADCWPRPRPAEGLP